MENDQTKQNHPDDPLPPLNIPWRLPKRQGLLLFLIASAATSLFYGESLVLGSLNAGFVYTLDSWHACVAHLAKLSFLVSQGTFTGIDFSTHGGASEFFLRPNLYPYHPFVLLYCFLRHPDTPEQLIRLSVLLLFAHSWVGCYFALRLCLRYLNRGIGFAVFVALGYTFSVQMVNALAYPPYVFCASMVPWAIYGGLSVSGNIFPGRIIRHSLPIFIMLTGGYVAIGVSCVALSAGFILVYILYVEGPEQYWRAKVGRLLAAYLPFGLAGLVVAPLYWAILVFHSKVPTASTSLYWSAQMLSEVPSSVLRLLSTHTNYEGPFYEFSLVWGFIPVAIVVLFFAGFRDQEELSGFGWRLLKFAGAIYVLFALAIYGKYSAVSDLLFAVPGIGKMHIYQRHLLAGHFFFVIAVGLMLGAVARRGPSLSTKVMLFVLVGMMAISAHLVATNSPAVESLRLNNYLVVELMLGALFAASLFFPGRWMSFVTATFLILLISLNQIYGFSSDPQWSYPVQQTKEISLDKANNLHVLAYFRSQSHKKIVKYLDLVPGVRGYFSKNYPWFVAKDLALSSYGGYEFQLAARADYLQRMNTTMRPGDTDLVLLPDWRWAEQTGAEFVIFQQGYGMNDPHLGEVAELGDPSRVLTLPNNIVIAPLRFRRSGFGTASVGGRFVRIQLSGTNNLTLAEVRVMSPRGGVVSNVAQGKPASQSSTPASLAGAAGRAVDGNTNGDFNAGSVTHTDADPNAWWQVDLGSSVAIDSIEIWNRTDCCGFRLDDFWVFVSDTPFAPSDTPATLEKRARTFSTHQTGRPSPSISIAGTQARESAIYDNGYLRVIGNEDGGTAKGFRTDGAATLELDVDAQKPVKVQYLFWPNDRLEFFLDGLPVASTLVDGMQTVAIPPGHKHLEIRYVNWPLRFFLLFYALYALAYIGALAAPVLRVSRLRLLRVMTV